MSGKITIPCAPALVPDSVSCVAFNFFHYFLRGIQLLASVYDCSIITT